MAWRLSSLRGRAIRLLSDYALIILNLPALSRLRSISARIQFDPHNSGKHLSPAREPKSHAPHSSGGTPPTCPNATTRQDRVLRRLRPRHRRFPRCRLRRLLLPLQVSASLHAASSASAGTPEPFSTAQTPLRLGCSLSSHRTYRRRRGRVEFRADCKCRADCASSIANSRLPERITFSRSSCLSVVKISIPRRPREMVTYHCF